MIYILAHQIRFVDQFHQNHRYSSDVKVSKSKKSRDKGCVIYSCMLPFTGVHCSYSFVTAVIIVLLLGLLFLFCLTAC